MKKHNIVLLFALLFANTLFAQEDSKPAALILNNGLGAAGINFSYLESTEVGAETLNLAAGASSPFIANPGIRFYTKNGFNEIGFKNILLGGRNEITTNSSQTTSNYQALNLFSSSVYFNKSFRLAETKQGEILAGIEPTFNYETISSGTQGNYLYVGRNLGGDIKLLLRWDHFFTENAFIGLIGGFSPFYLNYQMVDHRLTDSENPIYLYEGNFDWRLSQIAQISLGFKI